MDHYLVLGSPGDMPIVGDWDGDGTDGVGVFRPSNGLIYLRNSLTSGFADFTMVLGSPGDVGIAGDWNGDGKDSPGVYRPNLPMFFLTNQVCNCGVVADYSVTLGVVGRRLRRSESQGLDTNPARRDNVRGELPPISTTDGTPS